MAERKKVLDVVIVGGSLGGLMTGIMLKRLGHSIRILERSPSALLHNQGAGIVYGGPVMDFFRKYDRTHSKLYQTSYARQYLNKQGEVIDFEPTKQQMTSWDLLYNVLRKNFDGGGEDAYFDTKQLNELDAQRDTGKAEYLYGKKVTDIQAMGDEVQVKFDDQDGKSESLIADLVVAADGPSSTVRKIFDPEVERSSVGYVAWRGTVPESEISEDSRKIFSEKFTFFHRTGIQLLGYLIPGQNGTLEPGKRLMNFVWYCNYAPDSREFEELMTDIHGRTHHYTLPAGLMQPTILAEHKKHAADVLPPQFSELVQKQDRPFVQVISDVLSRKHVFLDGRVILVGDAVAGLRPHTAAGTSQAAMHALGLEDVLRGQREVEDWARETGQWARWMSRRGIELGNRSQFGKHPLLG